MNNKHINSIRVRDDLLCYQDGVNRAIPPSAWPVYREVFWQIYRFSPIFDLREKSESTLGK